MTTELETAMASLRSALPDDETDHGHVVIESDAIRSVLAALSTPPADDVREALAALIDAEAGSYNPVTQSDRHDLHEGLTRADGSDMADWVANRILSRFEVRPRGTVTDGARVLADPKDGCSCAPFEQDAGGGYVEKMAEYEPDCPEHSHHLYDPREGEWIIDPRGAGAHYRRDAGPSGSGHSPSVDTADEREDSGGSVEEPSTHLIHGPASTPPADDVREALAAIVKQVAQKFGPRLAEFANDPPTRKHYATADAIRAAFEVRPRGTVTAEAREAEMRELHHFEVEQQLAETIAIVKRAQAVVLRHEHTPASLHMEDILNEVNTEIPSAAEVRPRGTVTDTTPPADDVREALAQRIQNAEDGDLADPERGWFRKPGPGQRRAADAILTEFEVRPRGTVTDAARMEYTIAAESSNGAVTQLADYTTVVRDHLKADLYLFRQEEERLKGDPDRIFIAQRPLPKWVRS